MLLVSLCVCRVVYVRNLPFNITPEEMYDIFGKFGALRQVRIGDSKETRGTAFVVYEVGYAAARAVQHTFCTVAQPMSPSQPTLEAGVGYGELKGHLWSSSE